MSNKKILYIGVAAIGIGVLAAVAWWLQRAPSMPSPSAAADSAAASSSGSAPGSAPASAQARGPGANVIGVVVAAVERVTLNEEASAVGTIVSNESVVLRPEVSGRIARIAFRDGQAVRKGQLLVQLDDSTDRAEVEQVRAELDLARINDRRAQELAEKKFVSASARDEAASNVRILEARLHLAQTRLAKMAIRAPFDGTVGIRHVSVGDYIKDGEVLVNIEDLSRVKIDFRLPERYQPLIRPGQDIDVMPDALPGQHFKARLDAIDPLIDAGGRSVAVRALADNPEGVLRPGMFARIRVILAEKPDALVIPEQAIVPEGSSFYVYRLAENRALRTRVGIGLRRDAKVEIVQGLQAGDSVVVSGQVKLEGDSVPVRVVEESVTAPKVELTLNRYAKAGHAKVAARP